MAKLLTDSGIKAAISQAKKTGRLRKLAEKRLVLRCHPSGTATWCLRTQEGEKDRLLSLNWTYPGISLAEARERAQKLISGDENPIEVRRAELEARRSQREAERAKLTVSDLLNRYYAKFIAPKYRRPDEPRRMIDTYLIPPLGGLKVESVKRAHLAPVLEDIAGKAPVMANRVLPHVKRAFAYAVDLGLIEHSPAERLTRMAAGGKETPRDRALTLDELAEFLAFLDNHGTKTDPRTTAVLKLLILTGQRLGEVLAMRWTQLDPEMTLWTIPKHIAKNGLETTVPLSPQAQDILLSMKPLTGSQHDVFQPLTPRAVAKAVDRLFHGEKLTMPKFTPHDLRRTFVTRLADMGIPPHVIEKAVNHKTPGVAGVYNRADYFQERKAALLAWGNKIASLTEPSVIQFPKISVNT